MATTINVKTSSLSSTSKEFSTLAGQLKTTGHKMLNLVKDLDGKIWKGSARNKYAGKFSNLSDDLDDMQNHIIEYVDNLSKAADYYTGTEANNEDLTSNLKTDVIQ